MHHCKLTGTSAVADADRACECLCRSSKTAYPTPFPTAAPTTAPTKAPTKATYHARTALHEDTGPYFGASAIQTVQSSEASAKAQCDANAACRGLFLTSTDPMTYDLVASGGSKLTVQCIEADKANVGQCLTTGPVYTKIIACAANPCQHMAGSLSASAVTCTDTPQGYSCACKAGATGADCTQMDPSNINFVRSAAYVNVCPEGTSHITTHAGCNVASSNLYGVATAPNIEHGTYPYGCFANAPPAAVSTVYFNSHATGSAGANYVPICVDSHVPGMQ